MKLSQVIELSKIQTKVKDKKMSVKTAYKFSKLFAQVTKETTFFDENINRLVQTYGKRDENGDFVLLEDKSGVVIDESRYAECMKEMQELNNLEVELDFNGKFTLDELEALELSYAEFEQLMPFIEEE